MSYPIRPQTGPIIHPGEILLHEYLEPLGLSRHQLARDLHVPVMRISEICAGKRGITADTAMRLGRYFRTTPDLWLRLQNSYDLASTTSNLDEVTPCALLVPT